MPAISIYQVDAFTDVPFRGNPAAVCLMDREVDDDWLQQVAAEMNLAETAFVWRRGPSFQLRWFTPAVEVDLCGHATLAAAHVLYRHDSFPPDQPIVFDSRSGPLRARQSAELIELDFPSQPARAMDAPEGLLRSISTTPIWTGTNGSDWLVRLATADEVRDTQVDFEALAKVTPRGLIVTAISDVPEFDFISRFFAPAVGIDEDPVTGSAHCCLAPFWAGELNKTELTAWQASARGGRLNLRVENNRVSLAGPAVTVLQGQLLV